MIPISPRHWTARHLFGAWVAYWVLLVGATLWRPLLALQRIRGLPPNSANANVTFGDAGFVAHVVARGETLVNQHASFGQVVFWLTVPPILLWILWMATRPRPQRERPAELRAGDAWSGDPAARRDPAREREKSGGR